MMKRSEFGFKEWCEFAPMYAHTFRCNGGLFYVSLNEFYATSLNLDDACRVSVERFTESRICYDIPWEPDKPDFTTWTREQCEDYILSIEGGAYLSTIHNTQRDRDGKGYYALCAIVVQIESEPSKQFGSSPIGPRLQDFQAAAEYVWTQVNK